MGDAPNFMSVSLAGFQPAMAAVNNGGWSLSLMALASASSQSIELGASSVPAPRDTILSCLVQDQVHPGWAKGMGGRTDPFRVDPGTPPSPNASL